MKCFAQSWKDSFQICWLRRKEGGRFMREGSRHCRLKLKHFLPFRTSAHCDVSALFHHVAHSRTQRRKVMLPVFEDLAIHHNFCRKSKLDHWIECLDIDNLAWLDEHWTLCGCQFTLKSGIPFLYFYILTSEELNTGEKSCHLPWWWGSHKRD